MTHAGVSPKRKHTRSAQPLPIGDLILGFLSLFCLLLLLKNADAAITFMSSGLALCAKSLVPSLFPFAVLSELIASGRVIRGALCRVFAPIGRLLALSEEGLCALILGMLCGFPIGTRCAVNAYRGGRLGREEAERLLGIVCPPSPGFLLGAVGVSLFNDRAFGVHLYLSVLLSVLLTGVILRVLGRKRKAALPRAKKSFSFESPTSPIARRLTNAVRSATESMLLVCAYVVLFSTLVGALELILAPLGLPQWLSATLFSVFELSGGVKHAAALSSPASARLICAMAVGWSGISVHCQTLSLCDGTDLSLRPYLCAKFLQSALTVLLMALIGF